MTTTLEENISSLQEYLAGENSMIETNLKLEREIHNLEGEYERSQISYDRYASLLFFLTIIALTLFLYTLDIDVMYPFKLLTEYFGAFSYRQLVLVIISIAGVYGALYFSRSNYSKLATSLIITSLIYYSILNLFKIDIMGLGVFITFLIVYFVFDL